jgi:hypothetical protein
VLAAWGCGGRMAGRFKWRKIGISKGNLYTAEVGGAGAQKFKRLD